MTRTLIPRAVASGARVEPGSRVHRLVPEGRQGVRAIIDGPQPRSVRARHAFVCTGAVQTPALLLRSGARGLGRGLKMHPTVKVVARMPEPMGDGDVPVHQVKEFAPDITLGGSASSPGHVALALADAWASHAPVLEDAANLAVYYASIRSDGAGRVRVARGLPSPIVTYQLTEADMSRLARGMHQLAELLFAAGATEVIPAVADAASMRSPDDLHMVWDHVTRGRVSVMTIHLFSSVRMGETPEVGADSFGWVKQLPNVIVNDASLLPDAPGVNPQGTIMAIADRNCEYFLDVA